MGFFSKKVKKERKVIITFYWSSGKIQQIDGISDKCPLVKDLFADGKLKESYNFITRANTYSKLNMNLCEQIELTYMDQE